MRIALAGNPNSGKTTLFNSLTGANQTIGNWPGVTVERKEGILKHRKDVTIIDLPGIYSLAPYSPEEIVARNFLLDDNPDAIVNIVDATNLERNLYLTTQLLETGIPVVVALNMMDVVEEMGDTIDTTLLEKELGCPVVEISALKGRGIEELTAVTLSPSLSQPSHNIQLDQSIENALEQIGAVLFGDTSHDKKRWWAIKLFERDEKTVPPISLNESEKEKIEAIIMQVEDEYDDDSESIMTTQRYGALEKITQKTLTFGGSGETTSDKIDRVVTSKWLGIPIFAVVMFLVYYISVTTVGTWATDWANDGVFGDGWFLGPGQTAYTEVAEEYDAAQSSIEAFEASAEEANIDPSTEAGIKEAAQADVKGSYVSYDDETGESETVIVSAQDYAAAQDVAEPDPHEYGIWVPGVPVLVESALGAIGTSDTMNSLVLDGIVAGVGAVLGFVPQLLVLFLLLALLEQSGYLTRVAFVLDRIFRRFGLSGKSFIPMLISSGCGIPGIMASRTIENPSQRRMTIMTTTFVPCGAKIPVIALFAGAVFGGAWWVAPSAYFLGVGSVLVSGIILSKFKAFKQETAPFVLELPSYRVPAASTVISSMWERSSSFIKKAGTIILLATILVWFISSYGFTQGSFGLVENSADSLLGRGGQAVAWIFAPLGFGNWQAVGATFMGLIAKENLVSTFAVLYSDAGNWYAALQASYLPVAAYSLLAFNLLCAPCFAAIGAIRREMGNARWFWAAIAYQMVYAYAIALIIYQLGGLLVGEVAFGPFTVIAALVLLALIYLLVRPRERKKNSPMTEQASPAFN